MEMKILIYEWTRESTYWVKQDLRDVMQEIGILFDTFQFDFANGKPDINFFIYDACFSINYYPELSNICLENNIKYIVWGYDCPFNVRNIENTLGNPCNFVFCFDRNQANEYQKQGFQTVYYLPLGVNIKRYKALHKAGMKNKAYSNEISFVGNLYGGQYYDILDICDEFTKGYLEGVVESQLLIYGGYILDKVIGPRLIDDMNSHFKKLDSSTEFSLDAAGLVHLLDQETSRRERIYLLGLLGKFFQTSVYTGKGDVSLRNVKICDKVNYYTQMPYVFYNSGINLNITVKGIQSGIPLRALDVMASKGFLLSNYQMELAEYFDEGEEMVMYESIEDAYAKCKFYLDHKDLRDTIIDKGYQKVCCDFDMADRIKTMFEVAGL